MPPTSLWLRLMFYALALPAYTALPISWILAWFDYHSDSPHFTPAYIIGGFGVFFIVQTWAAMVASAIYKRYISGVLFVGNTFLTLALLLWPKPALAPLPFLLDPLIWFYLFQVWKGRKANL